MLKIIYEDNHIIVVEKPVNVPSQGDKTGDLDMLEIIKKYLKEKYNKPGEVYLGLVHRLDRPVGGVMVFAKTSKAASRLSEQMRKREIEKKYYAVVLGNVKKEGTFVDKLKKDEKKNKVFVSDDGKEAILKYKIVSQNEEYSLVSISLETGRPHQIRVQFSHHGHPLYGDQKYNSNAKVGEQIALFSDSITFNHPTTKESLTFKLPLPNRKPWNDFKSVK